MSIKLNLNNTDITVYDKATLNHASADKVIPLIINGNNSLTLNLFDLITNSLNLTPGAREIYSVLLEFNRINIKSLITKCILIYSKSNITYKRAIDDLIINGVIKRDSRNNIIQLNDEFNISVVNTTAKYIVIEVKARTPVTKVNTNI